MIETEFLQIGDYQVIRLMGDPLECDPLAVQKQIVALVNGAACVAVDLGRLKQLPNHLVIPLIGLWNALNNPTAAVTLVNASSDFRFRLQVANLDRLFRFMPSLDNLEEEPVCAKEAETPGEPDGETTSPPITDVPPIRPVISDILNKDKKIQ